MESGDLGSNGPGPLRHPRPPTAAELHHVLEKEQEAVVNKLSRELASLRQQTASVASNASSASGTGHADGSEPPSTHIVAGPVHPTSSRQHRSSSNLSAASLSGLNASTVSGITPAREPQSASARGRSSRQNSVVTKRPEPTSILHQNEGPLTASTTRSPAGVSLQAAAFASPTNAQSPDKQSFSAQATAQNGDLASQRFELERVRRENETLRARIQELEKALEPSSSNTNIV